MRYTKRNIHLAIIHALSGFGVAIVALGLKANVGQTFLIVFAACLIFEVVQMIVKSESINLIDRGVDMLEWITGGLIASLLFWIVRTYG